MITQAELKQVLHYNPNTGIFVWLVSPRNNIPAGTIAGWENWYKYRTITIHNEKYREHRLAYLYMTGAIPKIVNHKDHVMDNNKWSNLRGVDGKKKQQNQKIYKNNKSGITGVTWRSNRNKWIAMIVVTKKKIYLGCFENKKDAIKARKKAEIKYGFHENHGQ